MTMLEKFVAFAQGLPTEQRERLEIYLDDLMQSIASDDHFTADELTELDRRAAEANPVYANPAEIAAIFGKSFS